MRSMNEEDAAYAALLTQLFSDSYTSVLDDRIHSWIQHQYDFVFKENRPDSICASDPRRLSPSPSSSIGAHRSIDFDQLDVSLHPLSLYTEPTSSRDTTWLDPAPSPHILSKRERDGGQNCTYSVDVLKHGVACLKMQSTPPPSHNIPEKDLPLPPPSPVSSLKQGFSCTLRSRSSSGRMTRLPSLSGTFSSNQTQIHDIDPPPPVSVVHSPSNIDSCNSGDFFFRKFLRSKDGEDSPNASPSLSNFSIAYSRETHLTTPCTSTPTSPNRPTFISSPHVRVENVPLPSSPFSGQGFFKGQALRTGRARSRSSPSSPVFPKGSFPASPSNICLAPGAFDDLSRTFCPSPMPNAHSAYEGTRHHRTECSESRWSVTSEDLPSSDSKDVPISTPHAPAIGEKGNQLKRPRRGVRLLSLLTGLSAAQRKPDHASATVIDMEHHAQEAQMRANEGRSSKKLSLAAIRASFSLSRTPIGSSRPSLGSKTNERPSTSLPTSPIQTSHRTPRPSLTDRCATPLSKKSSLASLRASLSRSRTSFGSPASTTEPAPPLPKSSGHGTSQSPLIDEATPSVRPKRSLSSVRTSVTFPQSPPLPQSPLQTSFSTTRPSLADEEVVSETMPKVPLPKAPYRVSQINTALPLSPHSPSQVSFSQGVTASAALRATLSPSISSHSVPGTSSISPPSRRMSLASAAGIGRSIPTCMPSCESRIPTKPILRLTQKACGLGMPALSPPHLDVPRNADLYSYPSTGSSVPQSPTKFKLPTKLVSVLETQSETPIPPISISIPAEPSTYYMPKGQASPPAVMFGMHCQAGSTSIRQG